MKLVGTLLVAGTLCLGLAAQETTTTTTTTTTNDKSAKQSMKDAGHETGNAAKDVGHGTAKAAKKTGKWTKDTSKKVVHKGAEKTGEGADKVESKTEPQ